MSLPWVRLDSNIYAHDKILALKTDPSAKKWQAIAVYMMSIGWSGGMGTDGFIPRYALEQIHGNAAIARLLEKYRLWEEALNGWNVVNFADRQQLSITSDHIKKAQKDGAIKGNCVRHHGPQCGCWKKKVGAS